MPTDITLRGKDDYPGLPLLLSLIDTALDRRQPFGPNWGMDQLTKLRQAIEYAIFALLDYQLQSSSDNPYLDLFKSIYQKTATAPVVISLNYDIIADRAMARTSQQKYPDEGRLPDYVCDIKTPAYHSNPERFGKLLKLHGSLNWLYCPGCHRLDVGMSRKGTTFIKVLDRLSFESPLEDRYERTKAKCEDCGTLVRPILITPTYRKDYRNPHVAQVWYQAERELRNADHAIFIGYSLPEDDVEVIYLIKRGLSERSPDRPPLKITVVESDKQHRPLHEHPVGKRYRALFGNNLDWSTEGFSVWLESYKASPIQ